MVDVDARLAERLRLRLEEEAVRAVQLEGELQRLSPLLADFPVVVLKGPVLAHGLYPDPLLRPFKDLDLLVPSARFEELVVALGRYGYVRSRPEPVPGFDALVGKALVLVHPGGVVIDLHRTLVSGIVGSSIDVDAIVADRIAVPVGPLEVPAPSWEVHLVECALHAVVEDGLARALSLRDVAQLALDPRLDVDVAIRIAARWQLTDVLAEGLSGSMEGLGLVPPGELANVPAGPSTQAPGFRHRSVRRAAVCWSSVMATPAAEPQSRGG